MEHLEPSRSFRASLAATGVLLQAPAHAAASNLSAANIVLNFAGVGAFLHVVGLQLPVPSFHFPSDPQIAVKLPRPAPEHAAAVQLWPCLVVPHANLHAASSTLTPAGNIDDAGVSMQLTSAQMVACTKAAAAAAQDNS
jgi:hypothetical protein